MAETPGGLESAADRIRETAKWLTVSFAAIGTVMVAGSQLSSLGALEVGSERFFVALVGGIMAAVGALGAILATTWTATSPAVTLESLGEKTPKGASSFVDDRSLLQGYPNVEAVSEAYNSALVTRKAALEAHYNNPGDVALKTDADVANARAVTLNGIANSLVSVVSYAALSQRWKTAVKWIVVGAIVSAAGLGLFAWAANPPEKAKASNATANVLSTPDSKTVKLNDDGISALRDKLGDGCDTADDLTVLVLGETAAGPDVLIDTNDCSRIRLVMTDT